MKHVCKHPERQGKPVRDVVARLSGGGATDIQVVRNKTVQLNFEFCGRRFWVSLGASSHGRNAVNLTIRAVRHKIREAGLTAPAFA